MQECVRPSATAQKIDKVKTGEKRRTTRSIADEMESVKKLEKGVSRNVLMREYNVGYLCCVCKLFFIFQYLDQTGSTDMSFFSIYTPL
ncbi:hypothetical protein FKM82_014514 [Ascaphus truei]